MALSRPPKPAIGNAGEFEVVESCTGMSDTHADLMEETSIKLFRGMDVGAFHSGEDIGKVAGHHYLELSTAADSRIYIAADEALLGLGLIYWTTGRHGLSLPWT